MAAALAYPNEGYGAPSYSAPDYKPSYDKPSYANGRVKIQVYRGPNKEYGKGYDSKGYDDGAFAPWYANLCSPSSVLFILRWFVIQGILRHAT